MSRRKKKLLRALVKLTIIAFFILMGYLLFQGGKCLWNSITDGFNLSEDSDYPEDYSQNEVDKIITAFADSNRLSLSDYPESMLELLDKNPETKDFVLNYPLEKDKKHAIDFSQYKNSKEVPLFMQWDKRWGYEIYGNDVIGITGCGPTCLSMVAVHLLEDISMNPKWMAQYSVGKGYCTPGSGTTWTFMSEGARSLGLDASELPMDEGIIFRNLEAGNPIICIMGPGDFTTSGHFIVLTGTKDGKLTINDPNSHRNSEKTWEFDEIRGQIRNLWVYKKK